MDLPLTMLVKFCGKIEAFMELFQVIDFRLSLIENFMFFTDSSNWYYVELHNF